jgi:REP element-mobilizing transposase RayT
MEKLKPYFTYHIFNHANGFENVFREPENYRFFLEKYRKYISPVAETYAYCLMPNHFHIVLRIRKREVIEKLIGNKDNPYPANNFSNLTSNLTSNFSKVSNFGKVEEPGKVEENINKISDGEIEKYVSKQFANLFSSYTQAFNKSNQRIGSLFIKNFKRDLILIKEHFINAVIYTHRNPIHHGFCVSYDEWPNSSYFDIVNHKPTFTESLKLLKIFGGHDLFIQKHTDALSNLSTSVFEIP